jgi:hypothetical protein
MWEANPDHVAKMTIATQIGIAISAVAAISEVQKIML